MPESHFPEHILAEIVQRAATLADRLADTSSSDAGSDNSVIDARLAAWCEAVAKGDWKVFQKRLAWDGLTIDAVRPALGSMRSRSMATLPGWADTLREVVSIAATGPHESAEAQAIGTARFMNPERPLPFEEILAPFVHLAQQRLVALSVAGYNLLSAEAHTALERSLLETLTSYASRALLLEFSIARARAQGPLARLAALARAPGDRTLYRQFVQHIQGGLVPFFHEYAALAQLLALITDLWVEANAEFLQRLAADWSEIQRMFGDAGELGQVMAVRSSLSDPHRGRRGVIALTFGAGQKLLYKPRDLGMEEAYVQLLAWLNDHGAPLPLKTHNVLNRSTHGWVEFVEHMPCATPTAAQRYYRRAGMLLCLIYALEGTDFHGENIIASGEHPVLVDMEALLHHRPRLDDADEWAQAAFLANEQIDRSVLRVGLLPSWIVRGDIPYDMSGLGGAGEQMIPFRSLKWERINTDQMALHYEPATLDWEANAPLLGDARLDLSAYGDDLVEGFRQMYQLLITQRGALLAPDGPLHALAAQEVRFIYRATQVYGSLMKELLDPKFLREGVDRSIHLELLGRAHVSLMEKPRWWPVVAAEQQAIEQADIPFFAARASSDSLEVAPGKRLDGCFVEPSFNLMVNRLEALGEADLRQQVGFIRGSLYSYRARAATGATVVGANIHEPMLDQGAARPLASEELVAHALAIAEALRARAIRAADGGTTWIAPQYLIEAQRYQLQPIGYGLYDGACGIALFLAAAAKVTGRAEYRDLALGALQPLNHALRMQGARTANQIGIGAAAGLGSVVYALVRISELLDEPALLADARQAAALIRPNRIASDHRLDINLGVAGAILGLLALYHVSFDQEVLDRAIACGQHLLNTRQVSSASYRSWPTLDGKMLTGFAHGAAGIAYALLRLYQVTQAHDLLEAAREGIAYEDSLFIPTAGNWPDLRAEEQPAFMATWCYGAPGIGLARLGGLATLDTAAIRQDIDIALKTTQQIGLTPIDHLCCGNLGRAEFLLAAGELLSRGDLSEAARMRASQVVTRAEQSGAYRLNPLLPKEVDSPGFFQGTVGIAYELLRMAQPDAIPSVLLWQ